MGHVVCCHECDIHLSTTFSSATCFGLRVRRRCFAFLCQTTWVIIGTEEIVGAEQRKISGLLVTCERQGHATGYIVLSPFFIKAFRKNDNCLNCRRSYYGPPCFQRLLERAGDIQIMALASDGHEAVEHAVLHCPNVAVMDVSMPSLDGIEATKQICARCPETRVLMLSAYNTPWYIHRCIQAGALGYVLKDVAGDDLVIAVRSLFGGTRYFSKQIAEIATRFIQ